MYNLDGKIALVTGVGGKRGIGYAIALRLASEGADVVINDIAETRLNARNTLGMADIVREIEAMGRRAMAVVADVTDSQQVQSMVNQVLQHFGRIDILVNNAGAPAGRDRVPVVDLEEDAWDLVQSVNVKGTFLCSQAVARAMIPVNREVELSIYRPYRANEGLRVFAAYCTSKFAVRGFTQALAAELAPHAITVNAICPGLIETERVDDMAAALAPAGSSIEAYRQQMVANVVATTPLQRMGQPADVAQMAAFLASDQASFLTGCQLPWLAGN